jgi:hypothetical protein
VVKGPKLCSIVLGKSRQASILPWNRLLDFEIGNDCTPIPTVRKVMKMTFTCGSAALCDPHGMPFTRSRIFTGSVPRVLCDRRDVVYLGHDAELELDSLGLTTKGSPNSFASIPFCD